MTDTSSGTVDELDPAECWRLVASASLGRIAVMVDDGVDIYPVNFLVHNGAIYFSSAPGEKMVQITAHPNVAFEVDGITDRRRWSVVVRGHAVRLSSDEEIHRSGVQSLHTLTPIAKWNYVRVDAGTVTGRRFVSARRRSSLAV